MAGPTCSGKSALALDIAAQWGGVVINADSMQIYRELRILTARPSKAEESRVAHRLYGVRHAAEPGSVAWWRMAALTEIRQAQEAGLLPILCGGTGLYFNALLNGLADIPDPGQTARDEARQMLAEAGSAALHAKLHAVDPQSAARISPADGQRLARAWEVWRGTGRGIAAWQQDAATEPAPFRFATILLDPPRPVLRSAIAERFQCMLAEGALQEVQALLDQRLDASLPAMRAHGVPELAAHLRGDISLAVATERACMAIGRYTKRQSTWFRHHALPLLHRIDAKYACRAQTIPPCFIAVIKAFAPLFTSGCGQSVPAELIEIQ